MAIRLAGLERAPVRDDFMSDEEFEMAKEVQEACPHFAKIITIHLKLNIDNGMCEFNICFPRA